MLSIDAWYTRAMIASDGTPGSQRRRSPTYERRLHEGPFARACFCAERRVTLDPACHDTVLDLSDLVADRIDPVWFFGENHVTERMRALPHLGIPGVRLEGNLTSDAPGATLPPFLSCGWPHSSWLTGRVVVLEDAAGRAAVEGRFTTVDLVWKLRAPSRCTATQAMPFRWKYD